MAGPIERARNLLPQFVTFPKVRMQNFTDGASLFLVGLFKKLALANYLAFYVERVYETPKAFDAPALMLATVAFGWQIFFDFSGYTDMARGIAKVMGFPTWPPGWANSGRAGTSAFPPGFAIMSISRSEATVVARWRLHGIC
jgi:D-alanyl-lipoteichoic acid acyltransferase DltB (MBOAT superfamily)